jgi:ABC-2 type transport system permease protein
MNFVTALRKELLEQWRMYRVLVLGVVLIVFGLVSPLQAYHTPEILKMIPEGESIAPLLPTPTLMDAVAQYIETISQFAVVLDLLSMGQ